MHAGAPDPDQEPIRQESGQEQMGPSNLSKPPPGEEDEVNK